MSACLLIVCANLKRRLDRRFAIENGLARILGKEIEIFEAVDAASTNFSLPEKLPKNTRPSSHAVRLTKIKALEYFLSTPRRRLLFLEDDVAVTEDFEPALELALKQEADLVFLGGQHEGEPDDMGYWRICKGMRNNHALLFSREGAQKAIKILETIRFPWSDNELSEAILRKELYAICPPSMVAFQREGKSDNSGFTGECSLFGDIKVSVSGDAIAVIDAILNSSRLVWTLEKGNLILYLGEKMYGYGAVHCVGNSLAPAVVPIEKIEENKLPVFFVQNNEKPCLPSGGYNLLVLDEENLSCELCLPSEYSSDSFLSILTTKDFVGSVDPRISSKGFKYLFSAPANPDKGDRGLHLFQRKTCDDKG